MIGGEYVHAILLDMDIDPDHQIQLVGDVECQVIANGMAEGGLFIFLLVTPEDMVIPTEIVNQAVVERIGVNTEGELCMMKDRVDLEDIEIAQQFHEIV